jgi:hypothetical protein
MLFQIAGAMILTITAKAGIPVATLILGQNLIARFFQEELACRKSDLATRFSPNALHRSLEDFTDTNTIPTLWRLAIQFKSEIKPPTIYFQKKPCIVGRKDTELITGRKVAPVILSSRAMIFLLLPENRTK